VGVNLTFLKVKITELLDKTPKVSGATGSNQYVSRQLNQTFDIAFKVANELKDEYVSTEHILIALSEQKNELGSLLNTARRFRENVLKVLREVRGNQRVTDQNRKTNIKPEAIRTTA
jgi:ATP-dependent Clp protease ATP-binding subunit ClpB